MFCSWLAETPRADLPCHGGGGVFRAQGSDKIREEDEGYGRGGMEGGAITFTFARQRVFEEKVSSKFDAQTGSKETQRKEEEDS